MAAFQSTLTASLPAARSIAGPIAGVNTLSPNLGRVFAVFHRTCPIARDHRFSDETLAEFTAIETPLQALAQRAINSNRPMVSIA